MNTSNRPVLEPGLLPIFRLFVGARLVLLGLTFLAKFIPTEQRIQRYPLLGIVESALLLGYLLWPWLRDRLGQAYLPIALVVASAGPIIEQALTTALRLASGVSGLSAGTDAWHLYLVLFVPLILISWQYHFAAVIIYCAGTALLDLMLALPLTLLGGPRWLTALGLVFVRSLLFVLVGYLVVRLMRSQRAQREALARANAQLARYASTLEQLAISRERNRLARELHDTLAHSLSAVAVQLEAINALWDSDAATARSMLEQSLTTTREGLDEARRAIRALRAAPLEDLGLALALRSLAEAAATRAGLVLDLDVPERVDGLGPEVEQCLYRVAHEALANAVQHAQAQHLSVRLEQAASRLTLTVADDGRGFDPESASSEEHYGLRGMRERAEVVGGVLVVESQPGRGTKVRLTVEGRT